MTAEGQRLDVNHEAMRQFQSRDTQNLEASIPAQAAYFEANGLRLQQEGTEEAASESDPLQLADQEVKDTLFDAQIGDIVNLENARLSHFVEESRVGPRYAVVSDQDGNKIGVILNIGCIFDELEEDDNLGGRYTLERPSILSDRKVWLLPEGVRVDELGVRVLLGYSKDGLSVMTLENATYQNESLDCDPSTVSRLGNFLSNINAEKIGVTAGDILRDLADGLKDGLEPDN